MKDEMKIGAYEGKFLPVHKGHIFTAIRASAMVDKLYVVVSYNRKLDAQHCIKHNCKIITLEQRMCWLAHELKDYKNIKVAGIEYFDDVYDFEKDIPQHKELFQGNLTHVFSSEPSYEEMFKKIYPAAEHILIDPERKFIPAIGHRLLSDPFSHWEHLPNIVRAFFVKKILITGIESVGKSLMCKKLASYFDTNYIAETGFEYCIKYNNHILAEHFDEIAMKHYIAQKDALEHSNKYLFVDSDAVVTQYYLKKYCNVNSDFLERIILLQSYANIFYLSPEVKWVADGYRFLEEGRAAENAELLDMYHSRNMKLNLITGADYHSRMEDICRRVQAI
jgi:HTH-type transcriptional repressor of NAD biosynthesis genes